MPSDGKVLDSERVLATADLGFRYRSGGGVEGIDLELRAGSLLGILGANGSGKSTLLRLLAGLLTPQRGSVLLEGRPLRSVPRRTLARTVSYLSQQAELEPSFTALETVLLGRHPHLEGVFFESDRDFEVARSCLEAVDLRGFEGRTVGTLSGGERQRVALARLLAQEARILLLDEPATGLDLQHQVALFELLTRLARAGRGVAVALHDLLLAAEWCDELLLLRGGQVVARGGVAEVLKDRFLERTFGLPVEVVPSLDPPGGWILIRKRNGPSSHSPPAAP